MAEYNLLAEKEGTYPLRIELGSWLNSFDPEPPFTAERVLSTVEELLDLLDDGFVWPEGADAVVESSEGKRWLYDGDYWTCLTDKE